MPATRQPQHGAILLAVLVMLAVVAWASVSLVSVASTRLQREREEELLFVGDQYRQAIESYLRFAPNGVRQYPTRLDDLIADPRFARPVRHLRKLFVDPVNPTGEWELIKLGNSIVGVRSQSQSAPFKKTGFSASLRGFDNAASYSGWEFIAGRGVVAATHSVH